MSTKKIQILNSIVSTDITLAQEGKAADAKAVGSALAGKQPIGDYALSSEIQEAINTSNAYTDKQIESVLVYADNTDIEALF